jgi:iron complex transport system ATP-binding protein
MIEIKQLEFRYKHCLPILRNVSFHLERGECLCLLGPNGTGKTTLLKCLLNYLRPGNGNITLDGKEICRMSARERAAHLAYVSQSTQLTFPYSVDEVVLMGRVAHMRLGASVSEKDQKIATDVMEHLGISKMAKNNFQLLSGGERQMVLIARALAQQADYLIMDEPTAALDYSNQIKILNMIRKLANEGYGILMTTHLPDHAFLACSKAVLMRDGTVLDFGSPERVVTSENLTKLYHVPVCVTETVLKDTEGETIQKVCVPILKKGEERNEKRNEK